MTLDPDRYECPDHHTDLIGLVQEELELQGPPAAYRPGPRPFQVIITWNGSSDAASHRLTCTGTRAS
jgi:hypothetical protein